MSTREPDWAAIGARCWAALANPDRARAAALWQQEVEGKQLWQWVASWAVTVALTDMGRHPAQLQPTTTRKLAICQWAPLAMRCEKHSEDPCTLCGGTGRVMVWRGKRHERQLCECDGTGRREILLAECGCPTVAEAMGLTDTETDKAFNQSPT